MIISSPGENIENYKRNRRAACILASMVCRLIEHVSTDHRCDILAKVAV